MSLGSPSKTEPLACFRSAERSARLSAWTDCREWEHQVELAERNASERFVVFRLELAPLNLTLLFVGRFRFVTLVVGAAYGGARRLGGAFFLRASCTNKPARAISEISHIVLIIAPHIRPIESQSRSGSARTSAAAAAQLGRPKPMRLSVNRPPACLPSSQLFLQHLAPPLPLRAPKPPGDRERFEQLAGRVGRPSRAARPDAFGCARCERLNLSGLRSRLYLIFSQLARRELLAPVRSYCHYRRLPFGGSDAHKHTHTHAQVKLDQSEQSSDRAQSKRAARKRARK